MCGVVFLTTELLVGINNYFQTYQLTYYIDSSDWTGCGNYGSQILKQQEKVSPAVL